jgi:hypothetical protein
MRLDLTRDASGDSVSSDRRFRVGSAAPEEATVPLEGVDVGVGVVSQAANGLITSSNIFRTEE